MIRFSYKMILFVVVVFCLVLLGIVIWQMITLNMKSNYLDSLKREEQNKAIQIQTLQDNLSEVSTEQYQALNARKKGLGIENEKKFIAIE